MKRYDEQLSITKAVEERLIKERLELLRLEMALLRRCAGGELTPLSINTPSAADGVPPIQSPSPSITM
jgi:hypothetical protein